MARRPKKVGIPEVMVKVPIINFRDPKDEIGYVMMNPKRSPEGTDWALIAGVDEDGKIVAFTTHWTKRRGTPGTTEGGTR